MTPIFLSMADSKIMSLIARDLTELLPWYNTQTVFHSEELTKQG
jgi:hypothetical protein